METIAYPFILDPLGKIVKTSDPNKIYLDKIMTLLSTLIDQRPMRSTYGTDIFRSLYETGNNYQQALKEAITRAMFLFLPEVSIKELNISEIDSSGKSVVTILFGFPDGSTNEVMLNEKYFNPDGTLLGDIV